MEDFEFAKDKVLMGVERKTMMMTEEEKRVTAYHEAGHALVAAFLPGSDPLHKVTIIPRGRALGLTMQLPLEDKYTHKKNYVNAQIAILMGGRVAEELTQEDITTGAGNDIERATELARKMVREWGMSDIGPVALGGSGEPVFLGRDYNERSAYSDSTARRIDDEIERLVEVGHQTATDILTEHREVLETIARELLERESLDGAEVYDLIERMTGHILGPPAPEPSSDDEPEETEETIAASEASAPEEPEPESPGPEPLPAPST
jgi:cell division protease FtsH